MWLVLQPPRYATFILSPSPTFAVSSVLLYLTLLEGLQYFVPGREFYFSDLTANVVGVLAGLVIVVLWHRQQGIRESANNFL